MRSRRSVLARLSSLTTWPYLRVLQHPSPQLAVKPANSTETSPRHSPPPQQTLRGSNTQVSAGGGVSEEVDGFPFLSDSLSCLLTVRLARTPAPTRFAIPERAQAGGQAPLEMSAAADAPPRDLFPPPLSCFDFFFAFSSHKRQTLRISWGISSCRNCCHIPKVP